MYPRRLMLAKVPPHGDEGGQVADFEESCIMWRKSTASSNSGCVECAVTDGSVLIRDSVNRGGPVLRVPAAAWSAFLTSLADDGSSGSV